jgi:hypothetical protein
MASFTPSGETELESSTEIGVAYTGVDGLTIGLATGTDGGGQEPCRLRRLGEEFFDQVEIFFRQAIVL